MTICSAPVLQPAPKSHVHQRPAPECPLRNTSDITIYALHQSLHQSVACTKHFGDSFVTLSPQARRLWSWGWQARAGPAQKTQKENCPTGLACGSNSLFQKRFERERKEGGKSMLNVNSQVLAQGRLLKRKRVGGSGKTIACSSHPLIVVWI